MKRIAITITLPAVVALLAAVSGCGGNGGVTETLAAGPATTEVDPPAPPTSGEKPNEPKKGPTRVLASHRCSARETQGGFDLYVQGVSCTSASGKLGWLAAPFNEIRTSEHPNRPRGVAYQRGARLCWGEFSPGGGGGDTPGVHERWRDRGLQHRMTPCLKATTFPY